MVVSNPRISVLGASVCQEQCIGRWGAHDLVEGRSVVQIVGDKVEDIEVR